MTARSFHRTSSTLAAILLAAGFAAQASAQEIQSSATTTAAPMSSALSPVSQDMLSGALRDGKNWLHSNGNYEQTRYYPGTQISTRNVAKLRPAFVFQTAVLESMETAP